MNRAGTIAAFSLAVLTAGALAEPANKSTPREITLAEATMLVQAYSDELNPGREKHFGAQPNGDDPHFSGFYQIDVITDAPEAVIIFADRLAVDKRTGDFWGAFGCTAYHDTPRLRRLKRSLWRRIGLTEAEYLRMRRPGPYCDGAHYEP